MTKLAVGLFAVGQFRRPALPPAGMAIPGACDRGRAAAALLAAPRPAAASPRARPRRPPGTASTSRPVPAASRRLPRAARGNRRPARKRGCSSSRNGRCPARCSKRGCSDQISLIVASNRRGMAMRSACCSSTSSIASNNAGKCARRSSLARVPRPSTSCHSSVANRNAGRHRLVLAHAARRSGERDLDEPLAAAAVPARRRAAAAGRGAGHARASCAASPPRGPTAAASASRRTGARAGTFSISPASFGESAPRSWRRSCSAELRPRAAPRAACAPDPRGSA